MPHDDNIQALVDHLFRHQSGRMVAVLTSIFGAENLQLAEDVVQETLIKALQQWSYKGIPENPEAWLMQVAKNQALDLLRRQANYQTKIEILASNEDKVHALENDIDIGESLGDEQLTMLFMGCHPALSQDMQLALLLKTLGGFSTSEIARAFLVQEATIAQRIVRAKRKIRDANLVFELPDVKELAERLDSALLVIYLIFSEGYNASHGDKLIRQDLCAEAIRLCSLLLKHPIGQVAKVHAMMALMFFQSSRFDSRMTADNELLLLSEQDRSQWNQAAIHAGIYHLDKAGRGEEMSIYHLQAGIAACHALAPSYEETNWGQILRYYEQYLQLVESAIVHLNYAVALAQVQGAAVGLEHLQKIDGLNDYHLLYATKAAFCMELKRYDDAEKYYQQALEYVRNDVERRFLEQKLASIDNLDK